jgi:hypothetical protein
VEEEKKVFNIMAELRHEIGDAELYMRKNTHHDIFVVIPEVEKLTCEIIEGWKHQLPEKFFGNTQQERTSNRS